MPPRPAESARLCATVTPEQDSDQDSLSLAARVASGRRGIDGRSRESAPTANGPSEPPIGAVAANVAAASVRRGAGAGDGATD